MKQMWTCLSNVFKAVCYEKKRLFSFQLAKYAFFVRLYHICYKPLPSWHARALIVCVCVWCMCVCECVYVCVSKSHGQAKLSLKC